MQTGHGRLTQVGKWFTLYSRSLPILRQWMLGLSVHFCCLWLCVNWLHCWQVRCSVDWMTGDFLFLFFVAFHCLLQYVFWNEVWLTMSTGGTVKDTRLLVRWVHPKDNSRQILLVRWARFTLCSSELWDNIIVIHIAIRSSSYIIVRLKFVSDISTRVE